MVVKRWPLKLAFVVALMAGGGSSPTARIRTQFLSGAPAPAGLTFASFGRAATNARGTVCFLAGWDGLRHRPEGLYLRQEERVTPIVRTGDPIPGAAGDRFSFPPEYPDDFASFSLNDQDEVAFIVRQGVFSYTDGVLRPIARIGAEVPGAPDERWDDIYTVSLNNAGAIAFTGAIRSVKDGGRQEGVFLSAGDSVKIALFDGDQPADLEGALNGFTAVSLNDSGAMVTLATEGDDGLGCILLTSVSDTRVIAVEGKAAPGGVWASLGSVALNNQGVIAFQARVTTDAGEHGGIFQASGSAVTPVVLPGQTIGTGGGETLGDALGRPVIDDDGTVASLAELAEGKGARALLLAKEGRLSAAAVEGGPVPGDSQGTIAQFSGLNLGSIRAGKLVCGASLTGSPVSASLLRYAATVAPEVLLTTDSALPPGSVLSLEDGETPSREVQARINRSGEVVFAADVGGYGRALFRTTPGGMELITPLGQGHSGGTGLRSVVSFALNDSGEVALLGVRDEAEHQMAILTTGLHANGATHVAAVTGSALPGAPNRLISRLGAPVIDGSAAVVFAAVASESSLGSVPDKSYLLRANGDRTELLVSEGERVPGAGMLVGAAASGAGAGALLFREVQANSTGQVLFISSLEDEKTGAFGSSGLFLLSEAGVRPVALPGQSAPLPGGPVYTGFSSPRLSDSGDVTFLATVAGAGRKPRSGLFRQEAAGGTTLAAAGDPVPGEDGERYRSVSDPVTDAGNDFAFLALLDPPPTVGTPAALLIRSGPTLQAALTDGDPVDGDGSLRVRLDESFPAAPLALLEDGSLLVAARVWGAAAPDGLFLVQRS